MTYFTVSACSELDSTDHPVHGHRRPAELPDVVAGLRAQVRAARLARAGRDWRVALPAPRPECPAVVTERLPRQTREAALRQETERHTERLGRRGRAQWAEQLAEAELGWFSSYSLGCEVEGHFSDTFLQVDEELDGDTRWQDQLAAAELLEWLRLEAGLSDLELEALQQRAAGVAVTDRHCLARAQRRAQAALA